MRRVGSIESERIESGEDKEGRANFRTAFFAQILERWTTRSYSSWARRYGTEPVAGEFRRNERRKSSSCYR